MGIYSRDRHEGVNRLPGFFSGAEEKGNGGHWWEQPWSAADRLVPGAYGRNGTEAAGKPSGNLYISAGAFNRSLSCDLRSLLLHGCRDKIIRSHILMRVD